MTALFNVYCDESCHLEHDRHNVMVLGAIWCRNEKAKAANDAIKDIKSAHGLPRYFEIKWTKTSPALVEFYVALVDYFFDNDNLHFRGLIADKSRLNHDTYHQTHDDWYYKMYFNLLRAILTREYKYNIYIDIKDTQGGSKIAKLEEILSNAMSDFDITVINRIQIIRSKEVSLLQLTDLLIGAISYVNRGRDTSQAKLDLVERMRTRSGFSLTQTTQRLETKVNLFRWKGTDPDL